VVTYFPDLSRYTYLPEDDGALNIGWLDDARSFPLGPPDLVFLEKLAWMCARGQRVNQTRGIHPCNLCQPIPSVWHHLETSEGTRLLGTAEIRVEAEQRYAAPDLIIHYVSDHRYQPPHEFVRAVTACNERLSMGEWQIVRRGL